MYKDKDKQREAVKLATRRYRAKGITRVSRNEGITVTEGITPCVTVPVIPKSQAVKYEGKQQDIRLGNIEDLSDHARAMIEKHWRPDCGYTKQQMVDRALARVIA